jgi:hypothetical protein
MINNALFVIRFLALEFHFIYICSLCAMCPVLDPEGVIHETQIIICKSLTKRQIQCLNNISCHGFEFAMSYRALLPGFVNDPLQK